MAKWYIYIIFCAILSALKDDTDSLTWNSRYCNQSAPVEPHRTRRGAKHPCWRSSSGKTTSSTDAWRKRLWRLWRPRVAVREWMGLGLCYSNFRIPAAKGRPTNGSLVFFLVTWNRRISRKKKRFWIQRNPKHQATPAVYIIIGW